jgi:membrane associated rhomboid family serine protease
LRDRGVDIRQLRNHISAYDLFIFRYGYRPAEGSVLTLFSSLFLHAGWAHILGNMLFLWIFGNNVENRLGPFGYLFMYLASGVIATLFFSFFASGSKVPMLGASGAISGVLGCYFLWFPHNQVKVFIFLFPFFMDFVLIPARLVLGLYLLVDNLLPFLTKAGAAAGVAHGAHIGGFLAGLGVALALRGRAPKGGRG